MRPELSDEKNDNFHRSHNKKNVFFFHFLFGPHEIEMKKKNEREKNQSLTAISWKSV
jgi:hypothetical protein